MVRGTGVDIIEISRIRAAVEKNKGFVNRVFTSGELAACESPGRRCSSLAGRFAAKEAVAKALGTGIGRVKWIDIEIERDINGKPVVKLHGHALQVVKELGIRDIEVSISHSREYAVAFAIAY